MEASRVPLAAPLNDVTRIEARVKLHADAPQLPRCYSLRAPHLHDTLTSNGLAASGFTPAIDAHDP